MRKLFIAFALMCGLSSTPAHAQWITFDPTNLVQNILGVVSDVAQEASLAEELVVQGEQYYTQLQQYYNQLQELYSWEQSLENDARNLKGFIDNPSGLLGLMSTVHTALEKKREYSYKVNRLYGTVDNAKTMVMDKYQKYAASGQSFSDWAKREADANKERGEGDGFLSEYQANMLKQVEDRYVEVEKLQGQVYKTEGEHQALQLMNAHMNALLATQNQMLEINTHYAQANLNKDIKKGASEELEIKSGVTWAELQAETRKNTRNSIEKLKTAK